MIILKKILINKKFIFIKFYKLIKINKTHQNKEENFVKIKFSNNKTYLRAIVANS